MSTPTALGLAWVLAVLLLAAALHRPRPARTLPSSASRPGRARLAGAAGAAVGGVPVRWRLPIGLALAGLAVSPLVSLVGLVAGLAAPVLRARHAATAADNRVREQLPEVVDLVTVAVAAGLTPALALGAVAARVPDALGDELRLAVARTSAGERLADAVEGITARLGDTVRPLTSVLVESARYGTALVPALDRLAVELRAQQLRRAEEAARRLPVKLVFPLVLFILPAFALLTVAPVLAGGLRSLRL